MIKNILTFIKYGIIVTFGLVFIAYAIDFLGLLDFTLVAYAMSIISQFDTPLTIIFNYPNVMLILGFIAFTQLIYIFIDLLISKVVKQ